MADKKITELTAETSADKADLIPIVTDTDSTAVTKKITVANLMGGLIAPEGFLINGKIVPSVTSGNLTVAIKGLDGNNPSSTNPVYVRIGDAIRSITSALSVTKNAGTNWFNAGSSELATKEIDYFVYLGYNATDGVVIGFSRIPYATAYSQFSTTNTNEKYCAISNIAHAASGDAYTVIGRFAATLSAGAGYTWSVPTFTSINLIQRPIFETRVLSWTPTGYCSGSMTYTSITGTCNYIISGRTISYVVNLSGTIGGSVSYSCGVTIPYTSVYEAFSGGSIIDDSFCVGYVQSTSAGISLIKNALANWTVGSGRGVRLVVVNQLS